MRELKLRLIHMKNFWCPKVCYRFVRGHEVVWSMNAMNNCRICVNENLSPSSVLKYLEHETDEQRWMQLQLWSRPFIGAADKIWRCDNLGGELGKGECSWGDGLQCDRTSNRSFFPIWQLHEWRVSSNGGKSLVSNGKTGISWIHMVDIAWLWGNLESMN